MNSQKRRAKKVSTEQIGAQKSMMFVDRPGSYGQSRQDEEKETLGTLINDCLPPRLDIVNKEE